MQYCVGVVLSSHTVFTAGTCTAPYKHLNQKENGFKRFKVKTDSEKYHNIIRMETHRQYNGNHTFMYDLGSITVSYSTNFI